MLSRAEILEIIDTEQAANSLLAQIDNPALVGILTQLNNTYASITELMFNRMELLKEELTELSEREKWSLSAWYVTKSKEFQYDFELVVNKYSKYHYDNDSFISNGGSLSDIEAAKIVKQAAVSYSGKNLIIKIAGQENNQLVKLPDEKAAAFKSYIEKIKRPGTPVEIYNFEGDVLTAVLDVYYTGTMVEETERAKVITAVQNYLKNIMFNGVFNVNEFERYIRNNVASVKEAFWRGGTARKYETAPEYATELLQYYQSYSGWLTLADTDLVINMIKR